MKKNLLIPLLLLALLVGAGVWFFQGQNRPTLDGDYSLQFQEVLSYAWGGLGEVEPARSIPVVLSYSFGVTEAPTKEEIAFREDMMDFFSSYQYCKGQFKHSPAPLPPRGGIEISVADGCSPYRVYWAEGILWVPYSDWIPYAPHDPDGFQRGLTELAERVPG